MEWIPRRGNSVWARQSGKPAWASRNISPIQNFIWNWLNSGPLRTSPFLGSETGPPRQNAKLRLALRAQQSGASEILESRPPGASSLMDLGSMELLPQTLRLPARMQSLAWPSERSRAEWSGFRSAATPFGPENLENQPGPPETRSQYRISFGIGSILGRCAPPPSWAAKLGLLARMRSLAWPSERSRAEPQESSNPSPQGRVV